MIPTHQFSNTIGSGKNVLADIYTPVATYTSGVLSPHVAYIEPMYNSSTVVVFVNKSTVIPGRRLYGIVWRLFVLFRVESATR